MRLVQAREAEQAAKLATLREAVAVGIADIEEGRYTTFDSVDALDEYLADVTERVLSRI